MSFDQTGLLKIPVTGAVAPAPRSGSLRLASTPELLDELQRRARGLLIVVAEDQRASHQWLYRIKGSRTLMSAMSAGLTLEMHTELLRR